MEYESILLGITFVKGFESMLPNLDEIGRRRRLLVLSQKELAKISGVSQSMIAKIESGRISPSYQKTKAIFDTLEGLERRNQLKAKEVSHGKVAGARHDNERSSGDARNWFLTITCIQWWSSCREPN